LIDTALPTIGIRRGIRHRLSSHAQSCFLEWSKGMQKQLYNHPCVLYYTVFNEGWGQFDGDGCYRALKANDPTRIYDATSGWFTEQESDVDSRHIYFKPVIWKSPSHRPAVLSEFGGYSFKPKGHCFNPNNTYGYRFFQKEDEFRKALLSLYRKEILPALQQGLCATVLTQISDVEDETNGLLSYDRDILKVDPKEMRELKEELDRGFASLFS
jgi:hypothetical protein